MFTVPFIFNISLAIQRNPISLQLRLNETLFYNLPFTKEKDGKKNSAPFPSGQEIIFTCFDSLVFSIPTDNVYLLFNKLLDRLVHVYVVFKVQNYFCKMSHYSGIVASVSVVKKDCDILYMYREYIRKCYRLKTVTNISFLQTSIFCCAESLLINKIV